VIRPGDLRQLVRPRLSAMVAFAAVSGYLAAHSQLEGVPLLLLAGGVFLLTAAASIFNQVQERDLDRLLPRTSSRPLAARRLPPRPALLLGGALLLAGALLLLTLSTPATLLGLSAIAWYNLLYTPLKRRSSLALLLGALGGALPPLLGWVAAGASPLEPRALHLYLLLILWQVPHFWCLSLRDGLRCRQAGLAIIPRGWNDAQLMRQVRLWSLAVGTLLLSALPLALLHDFGLRVVATVLALWMLLWAFRLSPPRPAHPRDAGCGHRHAPEPAAAGHPDPGLPRSTLDPLMVPSTCH